MSEPAIAGRVSEDVHEAVEQKRKELGIDKSEAVRRAMEEWVGNDRSGSILRRLRG